MRIMGLFLIIGLLNVIISFYIDFFGFTEADLYPKTMEASYLIFGNIFTQTEVMVNDSILEILSDVFTHYLPLGIRIIVGIPLIGPYLIDQFIIETIAIMGIPFSGLIAAISTMITLAIYIYYVILVMSWIRGTNVDG